MERGLLICHTQIPATLLVEVHRPFASLETRKDPHRLELADYQLAARTRVIDAVQGAAGAVLFRRDFRADLDWPVQVGPLPGLLAHDRYRVATWTPAHELERVVRPQWLLSAWALSPAW